jgi:hypothetical protein
VPGQNAPADLPFIPVAVVDHTGESQAPNASCVEIPNEDEDCVGRELRVGKPEGRFVPGVNDCISFAGRTLNKCDLSPHPPPVKEKLNFLIALAVLALVCSLLGILQTGMLSGAPNYSRIRAEYNEHLWTSMSGIFFGLSVLLVYLRVRR